MKTTLTAVLTALFILTTGLVNGQSIPALTLQNGNFLIAKTRAIPPVNMVHVNELSGATTLLIIDENSMKPESGNEIIAFSMTVITVAGSSSLETNGPSLTDAMKLKLQKLQPGDQVNFEYIKSKQTDGTVKKMQSMAFQIK